jgi:ribosomal protein S18 acetylase RimI-like enzyme
MVSMTVTLRRMTPAEFGPLVDTSFARFVAELVSAGQLRPADAPAEIRRRRAESLPDGLDTRHMLLFVGEVDGAPIGWIWLGLPGAGHRVDIAWIYNVEVDEAHRGRGYGKDLIRAAEAELVRRGVDSLGLNVFAGNTTAIALYERLGYRVVSQQMTRTLTG